MDRSEITAALVSQLVAEQFPQWAPLPVRPVEVNGWDNVTFRLGSALVGASAERYAATVDKEQQWLPMLAPPFPNRSRGECQHTAIRGHGPSVSGCRANLHGVRLSPIPRISR